MKKRERKKEKFLTRFAIDTYLPSDAFSGGFRTEIISDHEAVVYGIKSICDYTPENIILRHKCGCVSFCGNNLSCQSFVEGAVCIRGYISSVHFER